MFKAIRDFWWGSRGRKLAGLFAFEFVVVMLGVLTAQALSDWAGDRAAQRRLDSALERVRRDAGYNMAAAQAWRKAAPCLAERMTEVMQLAAAGRPVPAAIGRRPSIRFIYFDPLSKEDDLLLRDRGEDGLADTIQQFDSSVGVTAERLRAVADQWMAVELLDPATGPALHEDRVMARHNAVAIRANLRAVGSGAESLLNLGGAIGAKPIFDPGERVPRDCAELWSAGQTMIVR